MNNDDFSFYFVPFCNYFRVFWSACFFVEIPTVDVQVVTSNASEIFKYSKWWDSLWTNQCDCHSLPARCSNERVLSCLPYSSSFKDFIAGLVNSCQSMLFLEQCNGMGDCKQRPTCYLLTSLRDHSVNYIGTTTQKLSDRLAYHNTVKSHLEGKHPKKGPWICTAIATGFGDDVQVMRKFYRLWTKEKEVASCGLSFDAIAKIGAIIQCNTH